MNSYPNFLIIGSAKCGTSTLASILAAHSDCCMGMPKEVNYFQDFLRFEPNANWEKGDEWYKSAFAHRANEQVVGEASPGYSDIFRSPNTVQRIYEFNSSMKIIYMVRNPIKRQISAWKMQYRDSLIYGTDFFEFDWASRGFEYWLKKQSENKQWTSCLYLQQIEEYYKYFPKTQVLISFLEDWKENQRDEVYRILDFLDLDHSITSEVLLKRENTQDHKINTKMYEYFTNLPVFGKLVNALPSRIKTVLKKDVIYPEFDEKVLDSFIEYVSADSKLFLKAFGKSQNYWN